MDKCQNIEDAKTLLKETTLLNINFSEKLPLSPLHWMVADESESIVVESTRDGLKVYDNPLGVMTNNPPFDYHLQNMSNYMNLSPKMGVNRFSDKLNIRNYGTGLGAIGLPGDFSSVSRLVKACFLKQNSHSEKTEAASVSQFFHILDAVAMVEGAVITHEETNDITLYASCINTDKGIYYYKTYYNNQIVAVDMYSENLDSDELITFNWIKEQAITYMNKKEKDAENE